MMQFKIATPGSIAAAQDCDGIVFVCTPACVQSKEVSCPMIRGVQTTLRYDGDALKTPTVTPLPETPAGRMVIAPTGPIDPDYDDIRVLRDAVAKGVTKALSIGIQRPLLYLRSFNAFEDGDLVVLLGALESLHVPIQVREMKPENLPTIEQLYVVHEVPKRLEVILPLVTALEKGRIVARDIGDGDPERMCPGRVRAYLENVFADSNVIEMSVVEGADRFRHEYPLFEAVDRAANQIERHRGCIIQLEYNPDPSDSVVETVCLVGKGVTYDTGGADLKVGGAMAGMSRDKCGAAAVAGFMKVVSELKPSHLRVIAALSMVRNSVGENCYVADELIKARSGKLVRVGNTDAEGRMVMADVLCQMKERAANLVNPHLFTVATLTGHACLAVGEGYSIVIDNGPANKVGMSARLQTAGASIGDPFEVSVLRREDVSFHKGAVRGDDVQQCNNLPSSRTERGHQTPAAFLLLASGLDAHGSGSKLPIKYSHLDIAASAGSLPHPSTGAPVLALSKTFLRF